MGFVLQIIQLKDQVVLALSLLLLILIFALIIFRNVKNKNKLYKTLYNKNVWFVFLFSIIGTLWRYWFIKSTENFESPYAYANKFLGGLVPDLGFYTGMAQDHANYPAKKILEYFFNYFSINLGILDIFILVFLYLGLIYILFSAYRKEKFLAYLGVILLSLGPVEIFHSTLFFLADFVTYIALFSLFLFFKSENKNIFWISFFLSVLSAITYYTNTMVIILGSFGFIIALIIKEYLLRKSLSYKDILKNKKVIGFFIIFAITFFYLMFISGMENFTVNSTKNSQGLQQVAYNLKINTSQGKEGVNGLGNENLEAKMQNNPSFYYSYTKYRDPYFFGLSAITWQSLFFFLCGSTFILYLIFKRDFCRENLDLLLCLIPVLIISFGFFYKNYPTRAIDYVVFLGLMILSIPKKYYKIFLVLAMIFIALTCMQTADDKRIFFENPQKEIDAAKDVVSLLNGKIFSDQIFIKDLILQGYYNVTGASDDNPFLIGLFYTNDKDFFLRSIEALKSGDVDYIVITKRMEEKYILMLNYPKKNIINSDLYENNLFKVYDNGNVRIYSTNTNKL